MVRKNSMQSKSNIFNYKPLKAILNGVDQGFKIRLVFFTRFISEAKLVPPVFFFFFFFFASQTQVTHHVTIAWKIFARNFAWFLMTVALNVDFYCIPTAGV